METTLVMRNLPDAPPARAAERSARILLVEDNELIRIDLVTILELEGFEVREATNGRSGLAQIEARSPDVVLSDLMMPEMDGYELLRRVRANAAWASIPFIVLSARGEEEAVQRALELGATAYLRKPVDIPDLLRAIRAPLGLPDAPA